VKDIIKAKKKKIYDDLTTILEDKIDAEYYNWAKKLLGDNTPIEILAAILNYCFEEELNPDAYGEIKEIGVKGRQLDKQGKARLFVALGKKDKINARKLVELIMKKVSVKSKDIRDIHVMDKFSFITVPFDKAEKIVVSFKEKGRKPLISHAKKTRNR
ncbi:MAG: DbpA RNA binding domain-containing protein, partial [Thermodesulfobacteriota bacterium]